MLYAGRTFAYRSNVFRSATLIERKPSPIGVSSGPLSATRWRLMESSVQSGIGSPNRATPAIPASCSSQAMSAPAASRMRTVAAVIEGPMPSPGIRVTVVFAMRLGGSGGDDEVRDSSGDVGELRAVSLRGRTCRFHLARPADLG